MQRWFVPLIQGGLLAQAGTQTASFLPAVADGQGSVRIRRPSQPRSHVLHELATAAALFDPGIESGNLAGHFRPCRASMIAANAPLVSRGFWLASDSIMPQTI
jgi:hypothetical protein